MQIWANYPGGFCKTIADQSSQACAIFLAHVSVMKGRSSKCMKGPLEQPRGGVRFCCGCKKFVVGHDKQNCPTFKVPSSNDVSTSIDDDHCTSMGRGRGGGRGGHK